MGWSYLPDPPYWALPMGIQVLNDGRLLFIFGGTGGIVGVIHNVSCVYTPSSTGDYSNGTWGTLKDTGMNVVGGVLHLADTGHVYYMGGHPPNPQQYDISRWNCVTDTWTYLPGPATGVNVNWPVDHQGRGGLTMLDDGRLTGSRINQLWYFNPVYGSESVTWEPITQNQSNQEMCYGPLPDGSQIGFNTTSYSLATLTPKYSAEFISAGSVASSVNDTTTIVPIISGSLDQSWLYGSRTTGTPEVTRSRYQWEDRWAWGMGSEIGPNMYHYKSGKFVMVGANAGEVFEVDPITKNINVSYVTPAGDVQTDEAFTPFGYARLSTTHAGQTAAQIVASGSLTMTFTNCFQNTASPNLAPVFACLPTANGRWAIISGTLNWSGTRVAGQTFTFTNLTLGYNFGNVATNLTGGDINTVIPTSSLSFEVQPSFTTGEGSCAILPSGKYVYAAGVKSFSGLAGYGHMFSWDGSSNPIRMDTPPRGDNGKWVWPNATMMCITPNGDLIVDGAAVAGKTQPDGTSISGSCGKAIYTETGVSPDPLQKPTITSIPTRVGQGNTHRLTGRQLSGIHVGATYGDETILHCNYPLVRITASDGTVKFLPTTKLSYRGIQPNRPGSVNFTVPKDTPLGTYTCHLISNGVASDPVTITVNPPLPSASTFMNSYK